MCTTLQKCNQLDSDLVQLKKREMLLAYSQKGGGQNVFNENIAGWDLWLSFKERYGFSMRLPENLSMKQEQKETLEELYGALEIVFNKHNLSGKPNLI